MHTQNCFLLSYLKYGDNDAILHCFSLDNGFQSFFAKGIYAAKNKKKPYLFPLNLLSITISKAVSENQIARISKIELAPDHYDFEEVTMNSILFFTADFLHQVLRQEGKNQIILRVHSEYGNSSKTRFTIVFILCFRIRVCRYLFIDLRLLRTCCQ